MNPAARSRAAPDIKRHDRKSGGFTLLELTITLALIVIVAGTVFMGLRRQERRALYNAAYQMQADIRYAQRHALISGREVRVEFSRLHNRYRIMYASGCNAEIRSVYLQGTGVQIQYPINLNIGFLPRGTISGGGFTITLESGRYRRRMTITPSGGRVDIKPIQTPAPLR